MCVQVLGIGSTGIRYCVKVRVRDRESEIWEVCTRKSL